MAGFWDRIESKIQGRLDAFNQTNGDLRVQQTIAAQTVSSGHIEGDVVGTQANVRMDDQTLQVAYVGTRVVTDGDAVLVLGGRIL